jgi:cell division septation protein DedD
MSEPNIREIQLSGKQLVFLFMASVVVAVAIFLLGVSVGRGVDEQSAGAETAGDASEVATAAGPEALPDATETSARDLRYVGELQEQASSQRPTEPPPVVSEPDPDPPVGQNSAPAAQEAAPPAVTAPAPPPPSAAARQTPAARSSTTSPQPPAAQSAASAPAAGETPAAAGRGRWFVQVDSFRSRENADRRVAQLKAQGFAASVASNRGLFQVRVGPFPQRPEAEQTATRLSQQEGTKPFVTR